MLTEVLGIVGFICIVGLISVKLYYNYDIGICTSQICLVGKTAIITGANSGNTRNILLKLSFIEYAIIAVTWEFMERSRTTC